MPDAAALLQLGDESFVSLTTFRKSGERVSTPVWLARDGDVLVVVTPDGSGKVKRLRNSPRVELRPCTRTGRVEDGAVPVPGVAEILDDPERVRALAEPIRRKYGLEYRIFGAVEALSRLAGRKRGDRIALRITAD